MGRIAKSITLIVGILLTVGAFMAYLAAGRVFNPPPYHVTVAIKEISPFTVITKDMLAVDDQQVASSVVRGYVLREEVEDYIGAVAIEPIHKNEPLVKARLLTGEVGRSRLALALDDPDEVAMTIPVDPSMCPGDIAAGDIINIIFSVGRPPRKVEEEEVPEFSAKELEGLLEGSLGLTPTAEATPSSPAPVETPSALKLVPPREVSMPLAKSVIRNVPV